MAAWLLLLLNAYRNICTMWPTTSHISKSGGKRFRHIIFCFNSAIILEMFYDFPTTAMKLCFLIYYLLEST